MKLHTLVGGVLMMLFFLSCQKDTPFTPVETLEETTTFSSELLQTVPNIDEAALEEEAAITPKQFLAQERQNRSPIVEVPANSHDALQDAINRASRHGVVLVKAGQHFESGSIEINKPVKIVGEPGAELIVRTNLAAFEPAIYIHDTEKVQIWGLDIYPEGDAGAVGILLHNAPRSFVRHNEIHEYYFGVLNEQSNSARIFNNKIVASSAWLSGGAITYGVININGDNVVVAFNEVSNAFFGIWPCDKSGTLFSNTMHHNAFGVVFCKVPDNGLPLPDGTLTGSDNACTNWLARKNFSHNNFDTGYLVIDGANNNVITGNRAANNAKLDYDLTPDTYRFGFLTPAAFSNYVEVEDGDTVLDCGNDNVVVGGIMVDEPCL